MKYTEAPFKIDKKYAENLRRKCEVFQRVTATRKNIFLTMITAAGIEDNNYARELVASSTTLQDLF